MTAFSAEADGLFRDSVAKLLMFSIGPLTDGPGTLPSDVSCTALPEKEYMNAMPDTAAEGEPAAMVTFSVSSTGVQELHSLVMPTEAGNAAEDEPTVTAFATDGDGKVIANAGGG